jgi:hypothetical protein
VGQLAASGAAQLQTLRGAVLLVAQPEKHRLQRLRNANNAPLTGWRKLPENASAGGKKGPFADQRPLVGPQKGRN